MNISGPAAVAKPEMLFYAPGDLTVTNDLSIPVLKQAIYVVKFQYLYSIEGFCRNVYSF